MKRLFAILLFCVLVPCAYGETINYSDESKYVGEVSNGVPHGYGTYIYASGSKYIGEFKDGNPWNGITYHPDGTVKGTYSNGEWIRK